MTIRLKFNLATHNGFPVFTAANHSEVKLRSQQLYPSPVRKAKKGEISQSFTDHLSFLSLPTFHMHRYLILSSCSLEYFRWWPIWARIHLIVTVHLGHLFLLWGNKNIHSPVIQWIQSAVRHSFYLICWENTWTPITRFYVIIDFSLYAPVLTWYKGRVNFFCIFGPFTFSSIHLRLLCKEHWFLKTLIVLDKVHIYN